MKIHVVVPTFREPELADSFLSAWSKVEVGPFRIIVVNGNPGDRTSEVVGSWRGSLDVEEIAGHADLFWTGLVNLGLKRVAGEAESGDRFLLTNIDVRPEEGTVRSILDGVGESGRSQVAVPVVSSDRGTVVSSGVVVRSWSLSLNRHLGEGMKSVDLPAADCLEATYLPTRFLLCPVEVLHDGLFPDEARLPHYCADYEYTNRLRRHGYRAVLFTGARAYLSEANTGFDTFLKRTTLGSRLKRAWDIKCPYNFRYRFRFVRLTYPRSALLPGLVTHFAKIALEILLGGRSLRRWRRR